MSEVQVEYRAENTSDGLVIIGAGDHASVVVDALSKSDRERSILISMKAGNASKYIQYCCGSSRKLETLFERGYTKYIVAIGDNETRRWVYADAMRYMNPAIIIHPRAYVSESAIISHGCMVCAKALVNIGAEIKDNTIINSGAIVEHGCKINKHVHIAPGAVLCGNVQVDQGAFVGANATVLPGIYIGDGATVGAGSVVTKDVRAGATMYGVPAREAR